VVVVPVLDALLALFDPKRPPPLFVDVLEGFPKALMVEGSNEDEALELKGTSPFIQIKTNRD
jgi:hypothetical protein